MLGVALTCLAAGRAQVVVAQVATTELAAKELAFSSQYQPALQAFDAVILREPTNSRALSHRAALLNRIGRNDLALWDIDRSIALDGGTAFSFCVRALTEQNIKPDDVTLADVNTSIGLQQTPNPAAAPDDERYAVLDAEDSGYAFNSAYTLRAEIRKRHRQYPAALADVDAIIAFDAEMTSAWLVRASIHRAQGDFNAALQDDLRASTLEKHGQVLAGFCEDHAELNDLDEGLQACNAAHSVFPRWELMQVNLGLVYLKRGELSRAEASFDEAISQSGRHAFALYGRGIARVALGDTEAGQADIPNALLIEADTPEWFVARGIKAPSRVRS